MARLKVHLLGEFGVYRGEERIDLPTKPIKSLLAYLVIHRNRGYPPGLLAGTFWGETSEEKAKGSLHTALSILRRGLPEESILTKYGAIRFNSEIDYWLDVEEFERGLAEGRRQERPEDKIQCLQRAIKIYQGDFMEGFYDDWSLFEQERLRELYLEALKELVDCCKGLEQHGQAIDCCKRILERSPLQEDIHQELMYLYYVSGDRAGALLQYKRCREVLKAELGVEPLPETRDLYERIQLQAEKAGLELISDRPSRVSLLLAQFPELGAPFVGRSDELTYLVTRCEMAEQGRGGMVLIDGEAGAGKTRLVHELMDLMDKGKRSILSGKCYQPGKAPPYLPLIEGLRGHLPEVDEESLNEVKPLWLAEVYRLVPELGDLLGLELQQNPTFEPEHEQLRLFTALTEFLVALSRARPLLILLDDLHHVDRGTLQYLRHLAHRLPQMRALLLGTYRAEEVGADHPLAELVGQLYPQGLLERMSLRRLSFEETALLINDMLGLEEEGEEFIQKMYEETEGNPLFLVELVKSLIEGGALYIEEGRWHTPSAEGVEAHIPPTVRELVATRLRRLSQRGRELLNLAAVAGKEIDLEVLIHANGFKEEELLKVMEELTAAYFLEETEWGYAFSQELPRQVIYEGLGPWKRRRLHLRIGEALESTYRGRREELAGELAHHFYQAGRWERALDYLMTAAAQAERAYAFKEVPRHLERAEEALREMGLQGSKLWEREFEILLHKVDIHGILGRREEQGKGIGRLFELAHALGDEAKLARAHRRRAELLLAQGRYLEAREEAAEELAIRRRLKDRRGEALSLKNIGAAYGYMGEYARALEHFELAARLSRELQDRKGEAVALGNCGLIYWYLGEHQQALAMLERACELSEESGDRQGKGRLLNNMGTVHWRLGDYPKALEVFTEAGGLAEEVGDLKGETDALGNIGALDIKLGRYGEAKRLQERALRFRREIGDRRGEGLSLYNLGIIERCSDRADRALEYLHEALKIGQSINDRRREAVTLNELGLTYYFLGKEDEALDCLERAAKVNDRLRDPVVEVENLAYRSMVYLGSGKAVEALERSQRAVALLEAGGSSEYPQMIYLNHSRVLAAKGVKEEAKRYLAKAYGEVLERASRIKDEGMKEGFLKDVRVNREIVEEWEEGA